MAYLRLCALIGLVFCTLPTGAFAQSVGTAPPAVGARIALKTVPSDATPTPPVIGTGPTVNSRYAVLVDADTGKVLWARNPDAERPIASTTKIMTAILLLENGKLTDTVTAPGEVAGLPDSSLHLSPGEKITLHDLLYAMLLRSANDTAVAGAVYLAKSVPAFADLMNAKARALGMQHTHFVTPNGLPDPQHYSCASDVARMACYAADNLPLFNKIVRTVKYKVTRSVHVHDEWVRNTSSTFLKDFPGADGIKTGYLQEAGHCFVGSATRKNWRLIAVALDSSRCREDVESLLNYGFAHYQAIVTVRRNAPLGAIASPNAAMPVPVKSARELLLIIPKTRPAPLYSVTVVPEPVLPAAPIEPGTRLGTVNVVCDGKTLTSGDAVAAQFVPAVPGAAAAILGKGIHPSWLAVTSIAVISLALAGNAYAENKRRKQRKTRAQRRGAAA